MYFYKFHGSFAYTKKFWRNFFFFVLTFIEVLNYFIVNLKNWLEDSSNKKKFGKIKLSWFCVSLAILIAFDFEKVYQNKQQNFLI